MGWYVAITSNVGMAAEDVVAKQGGMRLLQP